MLTIRFQTGENVQLPEKIEIALKSVKEFYEYFEANKHYFSKNERDLLDELSSMVKKTIVNINFANRFSDIDLWEKSFSEITKTGYKLRDDIFNEFNKSIEQ